MIKNDEGKTVERSRLALLGGLAAGAAGGGCVAADHAAEDPIDFLSTTFPGRRKVKKAAASDYPTGQSQGGGH